MVRDGRHHSVTEEQDRGVLGGTELGGVPRDDVEHGLQVGG